jgi:hypothetical protein
VGFPFPKVFSWILQASLVLHRFLPMHVVITRVVPSSMSMHPYCILFRRLFHILQVFGWGFIIQYGDLHV